MFLSSDIWRHVQVWHGSISFHAWWAHPQGRCVHSLVSALNPSKTRSESSSYTTQETPATLSYKGKTCLTKSSLKKIELQLRKQKNLKNNLFHVLEQNKHNTSCTVLVLTCFLVVDSKVGWKSIKQVLLRLSYNTMYTLQGDQDKSVSTSCLIPLIFSSYWLLPLVIITVSSRSRHSKLFVLLRYTKKTVEWRRRQTTLCVLWRTILCARTKVYKGLLLLLLVKNNNFLRWQRDILTGVSNYTNFCCLTFVIELEHKKVSTLMSYALLYLVISPLLASSNNWSSFGFFGFWSSKQLRLKAS